MTKEEIKKASDRAIHNYHRQKRKKAKGVRYLVEPEYWLREYQHLQSLTPDK